MSPVRPVEVRVATGILVAGAVVFLAVAVFRGDKGALQFPFILAVIGLLPVPALWKPMSFGRPVGVVAATLVAVAHVMVALGGLPPVVRIVSGLIAAAHAYAVVLLLTRPSRVYFGDVPHHE